jgi:poly(A) polymerase
MSVPDPNRAFAIEVVRRLQEANYRAYWAGGCVRDFLLGLSPKDYDVATSATPDEVRSLFGRRQTLPVGASFGVIIVGAPRGVDNVEVATFRTEGPYLDGRRPEHVTFSSPEEDAHRRDFTINGIFYDPLALKVLDFVRGEQDLSAGIVRAIGDPHDRMREDKLRMLRAVRFAAALEFQLDAITADAVREMAEEMHVVSAERIAQEFRRMLVDRHRMRAMQLTADVGLLQVVLPELGALIDAEDDHEWSQTLHMLNLLQDPGFELAAATLLHAVGGTKNVNDAADVVQGICKRLKLSNHESDHIGWLIGHRYDLVNAPNLSRAQLKRILAHRLIADLLALYRVETLATNTDLSSVVFCEEFLDNTPAAEINPPPMLTGDDLIAAGLKPGPHFKAILDKVRDAQLNGEITTPEEAHTLAEQLRKDFEPDKQ